jgi:hypothetical protein
MSIRVLFAMYAHPHTQAHDESIFFFFFFFFFTFQYFDCNIAVIDVGRQLLIPIPIPLPRRTTRRSTRWSGRTMTGGW